MVKMLLIFNLIRKTANELEASSEWIFSCLDDEDGKEALKTATRIFITEIKRLARGPEYEVIESPNTMTWDEAMAWAASIGDGWGLPSYSNRLNFKKNISQDGQYWIGQKNKAEYFYGQGFIFRTTSCGIGSEDPNKKNYACAIRELPRKTWQLA
jgi:hypothetical protein